MTAPTDPVPPSWERVSLPGLPPGVRALSIPRFGTSWHRRDGRYWAVRAIGLLVWAGVAVVQCMLYELILADDPHAARFGAEWWGVVAFGTLATAAGLWSAFVTHRLPLHRILNHPNKAVVRLLGVPALLWYFCVAFLAPGYALAFCFDALRPVSRNERIARADLDAQLRAR
ncbi:hypothetical protein [Kitasatospora viridis]|uniref:Uncharacterized protein n=1 Tax=Kitasatospora viridis TaxID=281105 RepID=A0A561UF09_9ACTN|nr:hypothetical protein [Kitasatospora viridis]TWF97915.1 hypothetical protein FHX73_111717 [Kitasatospora viridis]